MNSLRCGIVGKKFSWRITLPRRFGEEKCGGFEAPDDTKVVGENSLVII